jgi:hypothetical protein
MSEYSIGIEDHYAWANLVSVTTSGPREILLDKRRVELLDQQLTASPYHHDTLQMPLSVAEQLVRDVKTSANKRAQSALSSLIGELAPAKCRSIASREAEVLAFGTTLGPPWRKGHVVACAGAIFAHVTAAPLRPKKGPRCPL